MACSSSHQAQSVTSMSVGPPSPQPQWGAALGTHPGLLCRSALRRGTHRSPQSAQLDSFPRSRAALRSHPHPTPAPSLGAMRTCLPMVTAPAGEEGEVLPCHPPPPNYAPRAVHPAATPTPTTREQTLSPQGSGTARLHNSKKGSQERGELKSGLRDGRRPARVSASHAAGAVPCRLSPFRCRGCQAGPLHLPER